MEISRKIKLSEELFRYLGFNNIKDSENYNELKTIYCKGDENIWKLGEYIIEENFEERGNYRLYGLPYMFGEKHIKTYGDLLDLTNALFNELPWKNI